jgi:hypothetical protein
MYSREMLIGIILSKANWNLDILKNSSMRMGYEVRINLVFRGEEDYLLAIQRDLLSYLNVNSKYKEKESSSRQKPILKITGIKNLKSITDFVPNLPSNNDWDVFTQCVDIIHSSKHRTLDGFEELLKITGVL